MVMAAQHGECTWCHRSAHTLKVVQVVNFTLWVFYWNKTNVDLLNRRVDALLILIKNSKLPCKTLLLFSVFVLLVVFVFLCLILNLFQYPSLPLPPSLGPSPSFFSLLLLSPLLPPWPLEALFPFQDSGEPLPTFLSNSTDGSDDSHQYSRNCRPPTPQFRCCICSNDMNGFPLPAAQGWIPRWLPEEHKHTGGVGAGGRRSEHKDAWNPYPCSQVRANGSTTSTEQPKLS